jgi:cytochrome c5
VPHAARALDLQGRIADPDNIARVEQVLGEIELGEGAPDIAELTSHQGLQKGRDLLVNKCVSCHDMRTILLVPRTGARWHELVVRMQEKPDPFSSNPLTDDEVPYVTAYLVAITPDIQASRKRKVEQERTREQVEQKTVAAMAMPATPATAAAGAESLVVDQAQGKAILDSRCMDCHELDEIESFGGADIAGWSKVITDMVEEGAEITEEEARTLAPYLASIYAKQ